MKTNVLPTLVYTDPTTLQILQLKGCNVAACIGFNDINSND
ncbi:MAG: hypothetical protein P6H82_00490 [Candidatus Arsenophonus melophagi]|nr:hypothetical protein [Candidatus Arsenophonus melophagi]